MTMPAIRGLPRPHAAGSVVLLLLLALAGPAASEPLAFSWTPCDAAPVATRIFGCDTNGGADTLAISLLPNFGFSHVSKVTLSLAVCFREDFVPPWWRVDPAGCRVGALTVAPAEDGPCESIWDPLGAAQSTIQMQSLPTTFGFEFTVTIAVTDLAHTRDLRSGSTVQVARLVLDHSRTVGIGACTGCGTAAQVEGHFVRIETTDGGNLGISASARAKWQDATITCDAVTPASRSTWGAVETLYR